MDLSEITQMVVSLKGIISRAFCKNKESCDVDDYADLRKKLISEKIELPEFVNQCRNLQDIEDYGKRKFNNRGIIIPYVERRVFVSDKFNIILTSLEFNVSSSDLFKHQFPYGLPIGKNKPSLVVVAENSSQNTLFEGTSSIGVIRGDVYPNFTYKKLKLCLEGQSFIPSLNNFFSFSTEKESYFLNAYEKMYEMTSEEVPVLVPQVWIQWHSQNKNHLRNEGSAYADDLMRVDFVAFWKDRRFAILVDDISHYGKKNSSGRWEADEEQYSKRLKEDRKLRKESWEVFRVSNWEVRNDHTGEVLNDLKDHIGF